MPELVFAQVCQGPISIDQMSALVADPSCGAVVSFKGDVRNHDGGKQVASLSYEVHPSAFQEIETIAKSVIGAFEIEKVALAHRFGEIAIGESAFVVAVSAAHRQAAFDACSAIVDAVKERLPIWKYQKFADGTDEWVNSA